MSNKNCQEEAVSGEVKKAANGKGKRKTDDRQRVYAFLVYPDSAPDDWLEKLRELHIEGLVSPLHDKDVNPDGTEKKPHYHVLLKFASKKSKEQIDELRRQFLGENFNRGFENVASLKGYGRYMCHLDNPEKAQYSKDGVISVGGLDYEAIIVSATDDYKNFAEMFRYIKEHNIQFFCDLIDVCNTSSPEWLELLTRRRCYIVVQYIKSFAAKLNCERKGYYD